MTNNPQPSGFLWRLVAALVAILFLTVLIYTIIVLISELNNGISG